MSTLPQKAPGSLSQAYQLLVLVALSGELPASQLSRLAGGSSYKENVVKLLKRQRLLLSYYKNGLRGYRLTAAAKKLLLEHNPERFSFYLSGACATNHIRSEPEQRLRLHRVSQTLITMRNANVSIFRDEKLGVFRPGETAIGSICTPAFYTSREIKEMGTTFVKIRGARSVGVLLTPQHIHVVYNMGNALMKWSYTGNLRLESYGPELTLRVLDSDGADRIEPLEIGDIAHRQIGTHLSIPAKYYERMRSEDPGLLAHNVNTWLERTPAQRMIRVLDGKARAYLSNRYLRMDNYSIASAVLPILAEIPDVRIESCQITDSRMYIKAVNPRLQEDVTQGDTVQAGVVISNSEVGLGSVNIQPLIYRLVCSNGMVVNDAATKRNHIGRATDAEENFQLYSEKTLAADDHAFLLKVQDTVRAAAEEARFAQVVGMMREAAAVPMNTADVPGVVKLASRQFGLTDSEGEGILQHLIEGHDLSLYGLSNAVTRYSQDVSSYDRASDLEIIGYNILAMPRSVWSRLNQVSAA